MNRFGKGAALSCRLLLVFSLALLASFGFAHPANIPVAKAKIGVDGSLELRVHFDVLAFVCEEKPTIIADAPMNELIDGDPDVLATRLADAKVRFLRELSVLIDSKKVEAETFEFPSLQDIQAAIKENIQPRLPVMLTAVLTYRPAVGSKAATFKFAPLLDTVILTIELPYQEPTAEPLEPGQVSAPVVIPTKAQIDALAASFGAPRVVELPPKATEAEVRKTIQAQYDAWTRAYVSNDVDTLLGILAPDYRLKNAKGETMSHAEYAATLELRRGKKTDTTSYAQKILRITLQGGVAAVFSRETTVVHKLGPDADKTPPTTYVHDYIDSWIWRQGKWQLQNTVTQREQVKK